MSERRFEALVVDFGGVLTTPLQDAMVAFAAELGIELQDLVRAALKAYTGDGHDDLVIGFETGRISEAEFSQAFAARLANETGKDIDATGIVGRIFGGLGPDDAMIGAVRAARSAGLKTGLLSNSWGLDVYPRHLFPELFDVVVISGEVGLRKPDPEIFTMTTGRLGIAPGACVFVDDHPGHLKAAAEVGMTTVLHRRAEETLPELESLLNVPLIPTS